MLDLKIDTGRARLIRTRLIRSSTLFKLSVKCFLLFSYFFDVYNARLIRTRLIHISTYFDGNHCQ